GDPSLVSPDFTLEKFKTATRAVPEQVARVVSADSSLMDDVDSDAAPDPDELPADEQEERNERDGQRSQDQNGDDGNQKPKRRRRRRPSRSRGGNNGADDN